MNINQEQVVAHIILSKGILTAGIAERTSFFIKKGKDGHAQITRTGTDIGNNFYKKEFTVLTKIDDQINDLRDAIRDALDLVLDDEFSAELADSDRDNVLAKLSSINLALGDGEPYEEPCERSTPEVISALHKINTIPH